MNITFQRWLFLLVVLAAALGSYVDAQAADDSQLVTRVYPVADLIFTPPNYPFQGINIDMPVRSTLPMGMGGGGGGMGGTGLMGGGGFGGSEYDGKLASGAMGIVAAAPSIEQLTKVIQETVATPTWSQSGGTATMTVYGSRLIVSQTNRAHEEIKTLLSALRASGAVQSTFTIRAWWLLLDGADYYNLLSDMPAASPPLVNRKQLELLATAKTADFGEVTCFDGQTVHIISGRFRNAIVGVTPVVGDLVGYQPNSAKLHAGAMLEVTPTRLQDGNAVVLDLKSKFSQWNEQAEALEFNNVVKLDQTSVVSQQLSTTLKAVVGKPVLVGGLSLQPGKSEDDGKSQLFLVVEAIIGG